MTEDKSIDQPTLETKQLSLRPFLLSDSATVQQLATAFEVADTTLNLPHPYPDGVAEAWIQTHTASFAAGTAVIFAVIIRATDELCGTISLGIDQYHAHAELGYWFGKPYWNLGYATESASAMVEYGFTSLGIHRIQARHFSRNPASGRVMQKIGMIYEGCQREHVRRWDQFEDLQCYGILHQDWIVRRQQAEQELS